MAHLIARTMTALLALLVLAYVVLRLFYAEQAEAQFRWVADTYPVQYSGFMVVTGALLVHSYYRCENDKRSGFTLFMGAGALIAGAVSLFEALA